MDIDIDYDSVKLAIHDAYIEARMEPPMEIDRSNHHSYQLAKTYPLSECTPIFNLGWVYRYNRD